MWGYKVCVTVNCDGVNSLTDICTDFGCQNGGNCIPNNGAAICRCPSGFVGDKCEKSKFLLILLVSWINIHKITLHYLLIRPLRSNLI